MSQGAVNLQSTAINTTTIGKNTIIPTQTMAGSNASIKIWGLFLTAGTAQTVTLFDGNAAIGGGWALLANLSGIAMLPIGTMPWWVLADGNAFILSLAGGTQVSGTVVWSI